MNFDCTNIRLHIKPSFGLLLFILFSFISVFAQHPSEPCATAILHKKLMTTNPAYAQRWQSNEQLLQQTLAERAPINSVQTAPNKIPVVVHIIHLGEPIGTGTNISNAQIHSAIQSLNDAYRKAPGTPYDGNGVDANIEFCLVSLDTNGNPTSGIERINGTGTANYENVGIVIDSNEVPIKALSFWNNTKYYNIWVVSEIDNNNGGAGTQGYAYYPPGGYYAVDGAVILYNAFGFDPNGSLGYNLKPYTNLNMTAVHEIGHALDLHHTFQGDSSGTVCPPNNIGQCANEGDFICDIPPHIRSMSNCVADTTSNPCAPGTTAADYQHNYMDYSSESCKNMFSADQSTRMSGTLSSLRNSLITSSNLAACGCANPSVAIAQTSGSDTVCSGQTVTFSALPSNVGPNPTYQWYLDGDTITGATSSIFSSSTLTSGMITCIMTPTTPPGDPDTSNTITITVLPPVTPSVTIVNTSGINSTCNGNILTFIATPSSGGNDPSYQWHINGSIAGTDTFKLVTNLAAGTDIVSCTMISNAPCASPSTVTSSAITMNVAHGPVVNFVLSQNICGGLINETHFSSTPSGATYTWTNSNTAIGLPAFGSGNVPSFTAVNNTSSPVSGLISVKAVNGNNCMGPASSYTITVDPTPTILQNGTALTTFNIGPSYQWFRNSIPISGATSASYTPVEPGDYSLIIGNSPCSSNTITNTTAGVESNDNQGTFGVYPNPTTGNCLVEFKPIVNSDYMLEVKNALGQVVLKEKLQENSGEYKKELHLQEFGKGVYLISISGRTTTLLKKLLVY